MWILLSHNTKNNNSHIFKKENEFNNNSVMQSLFILFLFIVPFFSQLFINEHSAKHRTPARDRTRDLSDSSTLPRRLDEVILKPTILATNLYSNKRELRFCVHLFLLRITADSGDY